MAQRPTKIPTDRPLPGMSRPKTRVTGGDQRPGRNTGVVPPGMRTGGNAPARPVLGARIADAGSNRAAVAGGRLAGAGAAVSNEVGRRVATGNAAPVRNELGNRPAAPGANDAPRYAEGGTVKCRPPNGAMRGMGGKKSKK